MIMQGLLSNSSPGELRDLLFCSGVELERGHMLVGDVLRGETELGLGG